MSQLNGIQSYCGQLNLGGLMQIEYAPIHWIYPPSFQNVVRVWNLQFNLSFLEGAWLKATILPSKRLWQENQIQTEQGPAYEQRINAIVPGLKPAVSGELDQMAHMSFILRITDRNNQKWLLGSLESPLVFQNEGTTGNDGELKQYKISFTGQTAHKAYGFHPQFN